MYLYVPVHGTILLMEIRFKKEKSRRPNVTLYLMARFLETYVSSKHTGTIYSRKIKAIVPEQLACRLMRFGSFVYIDNVLISNWFQYPQF